MSESLKTNILNSLDYCIKDEESKLEQLFTNNYKVICNLKFILENIKFENINDIYISNLDYQEPFEISIIINGILELKLRTNLTAIAILDDDSNPTIDFYPFDYFKEDIISYINRLLK